ASKYWRLGIKVRRAEASRPISSRHSRITKMTTIEISGTQDIRNAPCLIEVDEFVPLRFRTYERPIGAAYVRVGNYSTTLVELIVDPISKLLRGLTLTSFECFAVFPTIR